MASYDETLYLWQYLKEVLRSVDWPKERQVDVQAAQLRPLVSEFIL